MDPILAFLIFNPPQKLNIMKKLVLLLVACFVFAGIAAAQTTETKADKPSKEDRQKKMREKQEADLAAAFKELGLTEEQVQQVKAVMQETNEKNKTLRGDTALSDDDRKAKMKANNDEKNEKIKAIMGEEKYKQFNEIRKKQKAINESMNTPQRAGN